MEDLLDTQFFRPSYTYRPLKFKNSSYNSLLNKLQSMFFFSFLNSNRPSFVQNMRIYFNENLFKFFLPICHDGLWEDALFRTEHDLPIFIVASCILKIH